MKAYVTLALALAALDQAVKALVRRAPAGSTLWTIPGVVAITPCSNTGAAFSLLAGRTAFIALFSVALLAAMLWLLLRTMRATRAAKTALACLVGGGIGNLVDRLAFGSVTDYVRLLFIDFPVFNLADVCVTASIGFMLLLLLTGRLEEGD